MRDYIRKTFTWAFFGLAGIIIAPPVSEYFVQMAEQKGLYDNAGGTADMALSAMSSVLLSDWVLYPAAVLGGFVAGLWADIWWKKLEVRQATLPRAFKDAVDAAQLAGIGRASARVITGGYVSWHEYDRAACVWFKRTHRLYCLPFTPDRLPFSVQDPGTAGYHDPSSVKKLLGIQDNRLPPLGGVAAAWHREPDKWSWMGGMKWFLPIIDDGFLFQAFENGFVAGPFPRDDKRPQGRFVWVVDGKRWEDVEI